MENKGINWTAWIGAITGVLALIATVVFGLSDASKSSASTHTLPSVYGFVPNSTELTAETIEQIKGYLDTLRSFDVVAIRLNGHVNEISPSANTRLSRDRAVAVKRLLIQNGLDRSKITARGWGATKPIKEKGNPYNSRVGIEYDPKGGWLF